MRTTIEIKDEHRARLLALAARRGEKGFSGLVEEALEQYFETIEHRDERVQRALEVLGGLGEKAAANLEREVLELRASWR